MCIRDRVGGLPPRAGRERRADHHPQRAGRGRVRRARVGDCLLYTSDAADERSSVDLGGRRIINKKNTADDTKRTHAHYNTEDTAQMSL